MSRRLPDPPTPAELVELARLLAVENRAALPAFLWLIVRSSRAAGALRRLESTGAHLLTIAGYPAGAALISSSRTAAARLARWKEAVAALDDVLPPIKDDTIPPL